MATSGCGSDGLWSPCSRPSRAEDKSLREETQTVGCEPQQGPKLLRTHGEHLPVPGGSWGTNKSPGGPEQQPPELGQASPHPSQGQSDWQEDPAGFPLMFLAPQQQKESLSMYCLAARRGPHSQRKNAEKGLRHCRPFTAPDTNSPPAQRGKRKMKSITKPTKANFLT